MQSAWRWVAVLMLLLLGGLEQPPAWGQLRTRSGAVNYREHAVQHPKELERRLFALTNDHRRRHGLPALSLDRGLAATAQKYSDDMLKRFFFSHTNPDGKTLKDRLQEEESAKFKTMAKAGENIASLSRLDTSDLAITARMIMDGWMTSPGHRANILNPNFTEIGIGHASGGGAIYWVQDFGRR